MRALAIFRMLASELASLSDSDVNPWILLASEGISSEYFGSQQNYALALLAAHGAKMAGMGGSAGGPLSSEKAGDLAVTYAIAASSSSYGETRYGRMYERLEGSRPFSSATIVSI